MGWVRRRERDVPANGCCHQRARIVIASNPDPGAGGRGTTRCAAARKDLDNDHAAAAAKGVQLPVLKAGTEGEIDTAFATLVQLPAAALVVSPDPLFGSRRDQLVALASRYTDSPPPARHSAS